MWKFNSQSCQIIQTKNIILFLKMLINQQHIQHLIWIMYHKIQSPNKRRRWVTQINIKYTEIAHRLLTNIHHKNNLQHLQNNNNNLHLLKMKLHSLHLLQVLPRYKAILLLLKQTKVIERLRHKDNKKQKLMLLQVHMHNNK